ncbi:copper chaperone PCu(A)C [Streptomyces sp. NPDC058291]|uniref:copper chaperone PCu(A)C n=1 Tax=Streptomyces sp. NPDC058291 TaxID=3346427 RepID=UPI0036E15DE5
MHPLLLTSHRVSVNDTPLTAASFRITNAGGSADRLVKVTTAEAGAGTPTLSRHLMLSGDTATDKTVASVVAAAGDSLAMSPDGLDVVLPAKANWRSGDLVSFTLYVERCGAVQTSRWWSGRVRTAYDPPSGFVGRPVCRVPSERCVLYHSLRDEWQARVLCVPTGDERSSDARMRPS